MSRRFGQAHWSSAKRSAEYYMLGWNADERTKRPGNVIVSTHVSKYALSEMGNYIKKLQYIIYEQK